ncbi:hypothetical protein ACFX13_006604 [Malus domestica]
MLPISEKSTDGGDGNSIGRNDGSHGGDESVWWTGCAAAAAAAGAAPPAPGAATAAAAPPPPAPTFRMRSSMFLFLASLANKPG